MSFKEAKKKIAIVALAFFVCGCPAPQPTAHGPKEIVTPETYVHKPSGMKFPTTFGEFERAGITRYDPTADNIGVGYNCRNLLHPVAATVYIYPSPGEGEFANTKLQILEAHPGAKIVGEHSIESVREQHAGGHFAAFEFEGPFAGRSTLLRSELYLFEHLGDRWSVKYRFTYPIDWNATNDIRLVMHNVRLPSANP
jgi:hypothetical protein